MNLDPARTICMILGVWEKVSDRLLMRIYFAAEREAARLPASPLKKRVARPRTLRSFT